MSQVKKSEPNKDKQYKKEYFQVSRSGRMRQKRTRGYYKCWSTGKNPIQTIDDVKLSLHQAIQIELGTIPPYLCALYSIREDSNPQSARIIQSVVMEEMLHLLLVANLLNALGEPPKIGKKAVLSYPGPLPPNKDGFKVRLLKFSPEAIDIFLKIEKPFRPATPPSDDKIHSIGQFYAGILDALEKLSKNGKNIFRGPKENQVGPEHYYGAGGNLVKIESLPDAKKAIDEIVGQGEGLDSEIGDGDVGAFDDKVEIAHYYRFNEIKLGRKYQAGDLAQGDPTGTAFTVDWDAVYNMKADPKLADFRDQPDVYEKALQFSKTYTGLLKAINKACNGKPNGLKEAIPIMYQLKYQAIELMKMPIGTGDLTAGPTFEYVP